MSAKVHVHMHVSGLAKSREFYRAFFGAAPIKEKPDYITFLPSWGPVNLALSLGGWRRCRSGRPSRHPGRVHSRGERPPRADRGDGTAGARGDDR